MHKKCQTDFYLITQHNKFLKCHWRFLTDNDITFREEIDLQFHSSNINGIPPKFHDLYGKDFRILQYV